MGVLGSLKLGGGMMKFQKKLDGIAACRFAARFIDQFGYGHASQELPWEAREAARWAASEVFGRVVLMPSAEVSSENAAFILDMAATVLEME